jgi:integrase
MAKHRGFYKRGRVWWADLTVNGERFQKSLGTGNWNKAQSERTKILAEAQEGKIAPKAQKFGGRVNFGEAADRYSEERLAHLAPRSIATEKERLKPLRGYFAGTSLLAISADSILAYIGYRKKAGASNRTVNMEIGVLRRILKRARLWARVSDDIKPLPERYNVGRALSHEEKIRLRKIADSRPEWQTARLAMMLALNTTMRACEIRGLQWRDVDFLEHAVIVRHSKTEAGERIIPLNSEAMAVVLEIREQAKKLGTTAPEHYLFPAFLGGDKLDPPRPIQSWRTAWRRLTRSIYCPGCGQLQDPGVICCNEKCKASIKDLKSSTAGLRFHDMRHHAITELAESGASEQTIMSIAGHVSRKMLEHYSHIRLEAKREAVRVLSGVREQEPAAHVTKRVTKEACEAEPVAEVLENVVDVGRLELPTPCLQSRCSAN